MSGRKNNLKSFQTITAGNMSGSLTSAVTDIQFLDDIGYQFDFTGSPTGTFSVEVSANYSQDYNGNVQNAGTWIPLTLTYWNGSAFVTGTTIPTSVGTPIYLDLSLLSAPYIKAIYTSGSGSGTLTATITAKMIG